MTYPSLPKHILEILQEGGVIPAHPLALHEDGTLDEVHQRLLTRYYLEAGAIGVAVGVHTTQFEIRDVGLYEPVLRLAKEVIDEHPRSDEIVRIAGVCGPTEQAVVEAKIARDLGYHMVLVSVGSLNISEAELIARSQAIAQVLPLFGFYLQPAVGGRLLSYDYWRRLADIPNLYAVKIAPFDRYETIHTVRAIMDSPRWQEIALYTGNDDTIVADLLTTVRRSVNGEHREKHIVGGLLGQWAVGTNRAVQLMNKIKAVRGQDQVPRELLQLGWELTDTNGALFDAKNNFKGCIAGIHQVLFEQGLMENIRCLNPNETLSPGQLEEIQRVRNEYPHLHDDEFIKENIDNWLR